MATIVDSQDGQLAGAVAGNFISMGRKGTDAININSPNGVTITGATVAIPGVIVLGTTGQSLAIPAGTSAATNTTLSVAGTAGSSTGAFIMRDTYVNGNLGTTLYCFNDLVRALKVAGVITQ